MKKILFVDDDPAIHDAAERVSRRSDCCLVHACDGNEALNYFLRKRDVDGVVTDLYMENDGFKLVQEIRKHDKQVPIIVISGGDKYGDQYLLDACTHIGANLVLEKPVSCDVIFKYFN